MKVYRSPKTGRPVSRAGFGYAILWITIIGARSAFSYGSAHWFGPQLGTWMAAHHVVSGAITDTLLLMAVGMLLTRTLGLAVRAGRCPAGHRDRAPGIHDFKLAGAVPEGRSRRSGQGRAPNRSWTTTGRRLRSAAYLATGPVRGRAQVRAAGAA